MDIREAVLELKAAFPALSIDGIAPIDGVASTNIKTLTREAERFPDQIRTCTLWLSVCQRVSPFREELDTYNYKHEVEASTGEWVSHLSFLVAVQMSGIRIKQSKDRPWAALLPLGRRRPGAVV